MNDHGNDNGPAQRQPATIGDVAAYAGVSKQTVSRAMNDKGEIRPETRARVLEAARILGYRPSSIARGLKTHRTRTVGLVTPDIANPFFAEVVRGASERAYAADYSVLLCNTDEDAEREWAILRMLEEHRVDGLVLISSRLPEAMLAEAAQRWRPLVVVNRPAPTGEWAGGVGSVLVNDAGAARAAVEYLLGRGHRRVGLLAGSPTSRSALERQRGFIEALAAAGLRATDVLACAPHVEGGRQAARLLLEAQPALTALLCYNDLVAVGALQACRALGRAVPGDCALIGWDDIVFADYVSPPLTTVRMPKVQMGEASMALLLGLLQRPAWAPSEVRLDATLIVRESA